MVTPYYNRPTQEGLYQHFTAVADAVGIPLILYNVPGRTGVNLLPETVARLASHKNIVAIKEATGSLQQASEILALCGDQIDVFSGDDFITFPMMACGAKGVISVTANIMPKAIGDLTDAFYAGDLEKARQLHLQTLKISNAMFIESNPVPVKTALGLMGKPMLVTVPFILLLLDYWPLGRVGKGGDPAGGVVWWNLLMEKVPLFALSAISSLVTIHAQRAGPN